MPAVGGSPENSSQSRYAEKQSAPNIKRRPSWRWERSRKANLAKSDRFVAMGSPSNSCNRAWSLARLRSRRSPSLWRDVRVRQKWQKRHPSMPRPGALGERRSTKAPAVLQSSGYRNDLVCKVGERPPFEKHPAHARASSCDDIRVLVANQDASLQIDRPLTRGFQ